MVNIRQKETERLSAKGFECVKEGDYKKALKIADQLENLRFSACFEIAAQAHAGLGDVKKAVLVLEEGVKQAPDVWLNWQLLGNYLSDLNRFEEAEQAYQNALNCTKAWTGSIHLNQAILANRQKQFSKALLLLDKLNEKELRFEKLEARLYSLRGLKKLDDAIKLANQILAETPDEDSDRNLFGRVAATLGRIRLDRGEPKARVRKSAVGALRTYGPSSVLFALIRDIDALYSKTAKYYRLLIHGTIPANTPRYPSAKGFYTTYDVVAEDAEEALNFILTFEEDMQENLFIEEETVLEPRPNDPKGVYWHSGYSFYEREK